MPYKTKEEQAAYMKGDRKRIKEAVQFVALVRYFAKYYDRIQGIEIPHV